jgi:hypothetical protein
MLWIVLSEIGGNRQSTVLVRHQITLTARHQIVLSLRCIRARAFNGGSGWVGATAR